jgi:hypothetical protein
LTTLALAVGEVVAPERLRLYADKLQDLPVGKLYEVLDRMAQTERWFPKIPDIREAVLGYSESVSDQTETEAELSWQKILDCSDKPEEEQSTIVDQPARFALNSIGGLRRLQLITLEGHDFGFARRDYIAAWKIAARQEKQRQKLLTEKDNHNYGRGI